MVVEHRTGGPSLTEILERPPEERREMLLNWHPRIKEWQDWLESQRVKLKKDQPLAYWPPRSEGYD